MIKFYHRTSYPVVRIWVNIFPCIASFVAIFSIVRVQRSPLFASPILPHDNLLPGQPEPPKAYRSLTLIDPSQQIVSLNKLDHCIDHEWYTYNSGREWQQSHFYFFSTAKRLFQELEQNGFIKHLQYRKANGDYRRSVTLLSHVSTQIQAICAEHTSVLTAAQKTPPPRQKILERSQICREDAKEAPKKNLQIKNLQVKNTNPCTIRTTTAYAQNMLKHRYYRNVHRVIQGLSNVAVKLVFEVTPQPDLCHC